MTTTPRKRASARKSPAKPAKKATAKPAAKAAAAERGKPGATKPPATKPAAEKKTEPAKPAAEKPTPAKPTPEKTLAERTRTEKAHSEQARAEKPQPTTADATKAGAAGAAAPVTPPPAAPSPAGDPGTVRMISWVALVFALLAVVGAVTAPWWSERFAAVLPFGEPGIGEDPAVSALVGRVQALEKKAVALETDKSHALAALEAERKRFRGELTGVMSRLQELEQSMKDARDLLKSSESAAQAKEANRSLKELSDRLAQLEEGGGQVETLLQRLDRIEGARQEGMQASAETRVKLTSALREVTDRLHALEQAGPAGSAQETGARAIVLAVSQLRDAIRRGDPYQPQLDALKAVADDDKTIAGSAVILGKHAAGGVPTLADLRDRFAALAGRIVEADRADSGVGWLDRTMEKVSSLVRIRKVGEGADPETVDGLVAQVERLLAAGDLAGAVDRLGRLTGAAAKTAAPWLAPARARVEAERALAGLHVYAVSLLKPGTVIGPMPADAAASTAPAAGGKTGQ